MFPKKNLAPSEFWRSDRFIFIVFVAIAFLWWLLISLNREAEKTFQLALDYEVPVGFLSDQSNPIQIEVVLHGEGWDLLRRPSRHLPEKLAVSLKPLENQFLSKADLAFMLNNQFNPGSPNIHFDVLDEGIRVFLIVSETKRVPLYLPTTLQVPPTSQLAGPVHFEPDSIYITGPSTQLDTIARWPLNLQTGISQPGPFILTAIPALSRHANVSVQSVQIAVRGRTDVFTEKKLVLSIATFFQDSSTQMLIQPREIEVWCRVATYFYNDLSAHQLQVKLLPESGSPRVGLEIKSASEACQVIYYYPKFVYRYFLEDRT